MEGGVKIACKIVRHRLSLLNRKCLLKSGCSDTKLELLFYSFQQIVTETRSAFCFLKHFVVCLTKLPMAQNVQLQMIG